MRKGTDIVTAEEIARRPTAALIEARSGSTSFKRRQVSSTNSELHVCYFQLKIYLIIFFSGDVHNIHWPFQMSWKKRNRRTDKGTDNALVTGQSSHEKNQQIKNLDFRPLTSFFCGVESVAVEEEEGASMGTEPLWGIPLLSRFWKKAGWGIEKGSDNDGRNGVERAEGVEDQKSIVDLVLAINVDENLTGWTIEAIGSGEREDTGGTEDDADNDDDDDDKKDDEHTDDKYFRRRW